MRRSVVAGVFGLMLAGAVVQPANAVEPGKKGPRPGSAVAVQIQAPNLARVDRQTGETATLVTFTGVDKQTSVVVDFGDGSALVRRKGRCAVPKAIKSPQACAVSMAHRYLQPGDFTITGTSGRVQNQQAVKIVPVPMPWTPPAGMTFQDGWAPLPGRGATFVPCSTVRWHFDRTAEPADRNTKIDDVRGGLAVLAPLTGLTFTEVSDSSQATLTFRWGDLAAEGYANAAGIGGPRGVGRGVVAFSTTTDWTLNQWAGREWRRFEWPRPDLGPGWYSWSEGPGRQNLVIHEVMHAMGFDHVDDVMSIMHPTILPNNRGNFSVGDIQGLNTMYLANPCPLIPD